MSTAFLLHDFFIFFELDGFRGENVATLFVTYSCFYNRESTITSYDGDLKKWLPKDWLNQEMTDFQNTSYVIQLLGNNEMPQ